MAWQSAYSSYQSSVLPVLQAHGEEIGRRSDEGDEYCAKVISYCQKLCRSFDPMTLVLLEESLEQAGYPTT
jgi:hypothetical protein